MTDEKNEFSVFGTSGKNTEDRDLKAILSSWDVPQIPTSLIARLNSSYRTEMSHGRFRARRPFYWAFGVAVAAGAGLLLWMSATRQNTPSAVSTVPNSPFAVSQSRSGTTSTGPFSVLNAVKAGPSYVPILRENVQHDPRKFEYFLTGKVSSEQGEPLPGAVVSVHESEPDYSQNFFAPKWPMPVLSGVCDFEGRYSLNFTSPPHVYLTIHKEGFLMNQMRSTFGVLRSSSGIIALDRQQPASKDVFLTATEIPSKVP